MAAENKEQTTKYSMIASGSISRYTCVVSGREEKEVFPHDLVLVDGELLVITPDAPVLWFIGRLKACSTCGTDDHSAMRCPKLLGSPYECWHCLRTGHLDEVCPEAIDKMLVHRHMKRLAEDPISVLTGVIDPDIPQWILIRMKALRTLGELKLAISGFNDCEAVNPDQQFIIDEAVEMGKRDSDNIAKYITALEINHDDANAIAHLNRRDGYFMLGLNSITRLDSGIRLKPKAKSA
jgi:hypothetical protein